RWGKVCSGGFGAEEASVVCRELGLSGGRASATFPARPGLPFIIGRVACTGSERRLAECKFVATAACATGKAAGVVCSEPPPMGMRLVEGKSRYEGRLEVNFGGRWGTVCDARGTFSQDMARMVCYKLGMVGGKARRAPRPGKLPILLSGVKCDARAADLSACSFNTATKACTHAMDVGIECTRAAIGQVRLVGGKSTLKGRVEVRIGSRWGTVCPFNEEEAQVVCRSL
ncbi:hypothetical protein CHLNCDRAFT_23828, partial [Chlorella variabilis]